LVIKDNREYGKLKNSNYNIKKMWIQYTKKLKQIKPQVAYVVSTFENTICIFLFISIEQIWIKSAPTKYILTTILKCSLKQFLNSEFKKERMENVHSSSTKPNTCIIVIFANLKNSKKECHKMWETSKMCQSRIKGLTWNGASIAVVGLNCIMILNKLDYLLRAFVDQIVGQILGTVKGKLAFEVLIGSKSFWKQ
jgi:hypothetical protein